MFMIFFSRLSITYLTLLPTQYNVLSSAYLAMSELDINKNKSHKNILKKKGSRADPCGAPNKISDHDL